MRSRFPYPCDGCALRRVRCIDGHPCQECRKRSLECTFLKVRKKRGPKGPRRSTGEKIQKAQEELSTKRSPDKYIPSGCTTNLREFSNIPLGEYIKYIDIFRERLYSVWPVLDSEALIERLSNDPSDLEAFALAASLCAAVIAQLRLPEHDVSSAGKTTSFAFVREAERLRQLFEYRELLTTTSLLTSFFLHIHYANAEKLRTAGVLLREAIGYAQGLRMHSKEEYLPISTKENQLKIRIFWILFISERTYCIQNQMPMTLPSIEYLPQAIDEEMQDKRLLSAFVSLTRLFFHLDSGLAKSLQSTPDSVAGVSSPPSYHKEWISAIQHELCEEDIDDTWKESQLVDIMVTRQWVRTLLWQYTISNFVVSCNSEDPAFSTLLPNSIARETLSNVSKVSLNSIKNHGYGIEIKLYLLADTLLDVLICAPVSPDGHEMLFGARDALHSLEKLLLTVGGATSPWLQGLRTRMAKAEMPVPPSRCLELIESDSDESERELETSSFQEQDISSYLPDPLMSWEADSVWLA